MTKRNHRLLSICLAIIVSITMISPWQANDIAAFATGNIEAGDVSDVTVNEETDETEAVNEEETQTAQDAETPEKVWKTPEEGFDTFDGDMEQEEWNMDVPEKLPADPRSAVRAVAKSQLGYEETADENSVKEDAKASKYGALMGDETVTPWDAAFAVFVLHFAGIIDMTAEYNSIPIEIDTKAWISELRQAKLLSDPKDSAPQKGDLVFLKTNRTSQDWTGIHAGIVTAVRGGTFYVVGATTAKETNSVTRNKWTMQDIAGYVSLETIAPDLFAEDADKAETDTEEADVETANEEDVDDEAKATEDSTAPDQDAKAETAEQETKAEEPVSKEKDAADNVADLKISNQTIEAQLVSGPGVGGKLGALGRMISGSEKNTIIKLSGEMPEGAIAKAYPVKVEVPGQNVLAAYDITIYVEDENGELTEWQPDGSIYVSVSADALEDAEGRVSIYHMEEKNAKAEFVQKGDVADGAVEFRAEQFSIYVVTEKEPTPVVTYEFTYGSEDNGTKTTFTTTVPEGEQLLEPATPSDPKLGKFVAWYWDEDLTDEVHFDNEASVTATDAPRTVKVYGKFDGKKYLSFMSLPMDDNTRRTFQTFVLEPDETEFSLNQVNTYGAPVNRKFRGWTTTLDQTDPYNNKLHHSDNAAQSQYYTLDETITNITESMTFYPVVKDGIWVTFDADPGYGTATATGGLVDGKRTKKVMAAEDEKWSEVYGQIDTVAAEGYTLDKWVDKDTGEAFAFEGNTSTIGDEEENYSFDAKWTPRNDVNVTFMFWKEDVEPELYTLIKSENRTYTAGATVDLMDELTDAESLLNGAFKRNDADMEFFYLAEITSGDGTTDENKWGTANHSQYVNVKGDGSTVINVWYDRKIVKLTFQDCYTTLVRLGEPLDGVWPTTDRSGNTLTGFKLSSSLNALYIYPTASSMVLGGLTSRDGSINLNDAEYKDRNNETHLIQEQSYYEDIKDQYQAVKTLEKITGTPANTAKHWYEKTDVASSASGISYAADSAPDKQFKTSAGSIVTREVDGYRIDYAKTRTRQGSSNVSVSSRYEDGAEKQLGVKVRNKEFLVYYKANKYAIALFDGERMLARNDGVKFKTPLTSDWVKISGHSLNDLLAVDDDGVPTAEAEALARSLYGKKAPADYMQFKGWYIDRDFAATDSTYRADGKQMPSADLNLYARWEPRKVEVTVDKGTRSGQKEQPDEVNPDNISAGTQILEYKNTNDHSFYAHANTLGDYLAEGWMNPTWKNHVFLGWQYRTKTGDGEDDWSAWKDVTNWNDNVDHDTQLRGQWQDMTPFSVHYFVDGREVNLDTATYLNGGKVILQGYDKTDAAGDVFHGWTLRGGDGTMLEPGSEQTIQGGDLYLDGVFKPGSVNPGEDPALYVFMIWVPNNASQADKDKYEAWADDAARTERGALTGNYNQDATYYGSTDNTAGEWKVFYQEIIYSGDPLTMPPTVPDSMIEGESQFQGWYSNPGLTSRYEKFGTVDTPHSTIIYAGFKAPKTVTYHTIDGRVLEVQNYAWDGKDQLNPGSVGLNYSFSDSQGKTYKLVKWTTYDVSQKSGDARLMSEDQIRDEDSSASFYEKGVASTDLVDSNMHLYPVMVEGYTLTFDTDGGSYIEPVVYLADEPTEAPDPPTKGTGNQFQWLGWYEEDPHENTTHNTFEWGHTISEDTTVYGWFSDTEEQQEITASVWMQNADGETYSFAGSTVVASDDPDLSDNKQPINTLFTLSDAHRQDLESSNAKPIGAILGNDGRSYFEFNQTKSNTSVMVSKDKDENVLNLYYDRKHYTLEFNTGAGSFDNSKISSDSDKGTSLSSDNKKYTISDVWLGKDLTDTWPSGDAVNYAGNYFTSWQAGSSSYKAVTTADQDLLNKADNSGKCTLTAQYQTFTTGNIVDDSIRSDDDFDKDTGRRYKVVVNHHLRSTDASSERVVTDTVYVTGKQYKENYETPVQENDKATINSWTDLKGSYSGYSFDGNSTNAGDTSTESSEYLYKYALNKSYLYYTFTQQGRISYRSNLGVELSHANNGHVYKYPVSVKGDWTSEGHATLIGNGNELTAETEVYRNTDYFSFGGIGRADYAIIGSATATHYGNDGISAVQNRSGTSPSGTHYTNSVEYLSNPENGYVKVNETRTITTYTPGVITIDYYYTKDAPTQHAVTRSYGASTNNAGSFAAGDVITASDLGTAAVADHTADIQTYFGDKYNAEHPYKFTGWYLDATRTTKIPADGMVMPDKDVTVYAGWVDETESSDSKVTVTTLVGDTRTNFSRDKGAAFGSFNIPNSVAASALDEGDVLLGWYRENDEYKSAIRMTEPITENITVKPLILKAGQTFHVKYSMNGIIATANPLYGQETDESGDVYVTEQGYYPSAHVTVASVDSSKLDFVGSNKKGLAQFYCWNTKADGTGDSYYPNETVTIPTDGDLTLYAMYSPYMNTSLVYDLGYDDAPSIDEEDRTVVFKDYKDDSRGAHQLYTNTVYKVGTQYQGENAAEEKYYDTLLFDSERVEYIRPGYTFLGWLDKSAKAEYAEADADHQAAMLLHEGDTIRVNAPDIDENGELVKEYLEAQWSQDILPVNVYDCAGGRWTSVTDSDLVASDEYTTDQKITLDLTGENSYKQPENEFARSFYDPAESADYPIYGFASVNGTIVTSLEYKEKADGSGYAWTYVKDGKTVELAAGDALNLYFVPKKAEVTVKYRIVYDGKYYTNYDGTSVDQVFDTSAVPGFDNSADKMQVTYPNITLEDSAQIIAQGPTNSDYELVGVFHGKDFDKEKEITGAKKIYYKGGQLRINSADGDPVDDGEIYVVYHKNSDVMVEAGFASVAAGTGGELVTTMMDGKTYIDVPKGGSRDNLTQPAREGYDKYDISVGTANGSGSATVYDDPDNNGCPKVNKLSESDGTITAHGSLAFTRDMGADDIIIYRYVEARTITAYVFAYDWSGKAAFEKKLTLSVIPDGIVPSSDDPEDPERNPGGRALADQKLLSPVAEYDLEEVYCLQDKGGNLPAEPGDNIISESIENDADGIVHYQNSSNKTLIADDQALYFVYRPNVRNIPIKYLEKTDDGYIPYNNAANDQTVPVKVSAGADGKLDLSTAAYSYGGTDYTLFNAPAGYTTAEVNFLGTSKDDLTKLTERQVENRANGAYVTIGDNNEKRMTAAQAIYYVYYPDPRTVTVHFVEKKPSGELVPITAGNAVISPKDINVSVSGDPAGLAMNDAGFRAAKRTESGNQVDALTAAEKSALDNYAFAGSYLGETAGDDFASIGKSDQTVTDRTLVNLLDGLAFAASTNPAAEELPLGTHDVYAVYYPQPRTIAAHAAVYDHGKLIQKDELLTDAQKTVSVGPDGVTVNKIDSVTYTDPEDNTNTSSYSGIGVNYGAVAAGLDMGKNAPSLQLSNSEDGISVTSGGSTYTLDTNEELYYIFYPNPRKVNVYYVSKNADGSLKELKNADTASVGSDGIFTISEDASGQSAIAFPDIISKNGFDHIAVGPNMAVDYESDPDDPENPDKDTVVVLTGAGDLNQVSSEALYLKNEQNAVNYAAEKSGSALTNPSEMAAASPAVYIVYEPFVTLTISKEIEGQYADMTRSFSFTMHVDGISDDETFTLGDGDSTSFDVPQNKEITVTETSVSGYTPSFAVGGGATAATGTVDNGKKITVSDSNGTLEVTNTFDDESIVPSGIAGGKFGIFTWLLLLLAFFSAGFFWIRRRRVS